MSNTNSSVGQGAFGQVFLLPNLQRKTKDKYQILSVFDNIKGEIIDISEFDVNNYPKSVIKLQPISDAAQMEMVVNQRISELCQSSKFFVKTSVFIIFKHLDTQEYYMGLVFDQLTPIDIQELATSIQSEKNPQKAGETYMKVDKLEEQCKRFVMNLSNLLRATRVMTKNGLVHNDIKPENCVWDEDKEVLKYIDMGSMSSIKDISNDFDFIVSLTPVYGSDPALSMMTTMKIGEFPKFKHFKGLAGVAKSSEVDEDFAMLKTYFNNGHSPTQTFLNIRASYETNEKIFEEFKYFMDINQLGNSLLKVLLVQATFIDGIKQVQRGGNSGTFVVHNNNVSNASGTFVVHNVQKSVSGSGSGSKNVQLSPQQLQKQKLQLQQTYKSGDYFKQSLQKTVALQDCKIQNTSIPVQNNSKSIQQVMSQTMPNEKSKDINPLATLLKMMLNAYNYSSDSNKETYPIRVHRLYVKTMKYYNDKKGYISIIDDLYDILDNASQMM